MDKIKTIENLVKKNLSKWLWVHIQAIRPIAKELAELENADKQIVDVAVLFHDIAKNHSSLLKHARESAKMCGKSLRELDFDEEFIKKVIHCVEAHSTPWAKNGPTPSSIEAKIVFDADMLQQLSAFGITKHVLKYQDKQFRELIKLAEKDLVAGAYELLITESGKKLGKERIDYVKTFFKNVVSGN